MLEKIDLSKKADKETFKQVMETESGRLECSHAYPGTEISFGEETLRLRHERRKCAASLVKGEIVVT